MWVLRGQPLQLIDHLGRLRISAASRINNHLAQSVLYLTPRQ